MSSLGLADPRVWTRWCGFQAACEGGGCNPYVEPVLGKVSAFVFQDSHLFSKRRRDVGG